MKQFQFYMWDDPEEYAWEALTQEQAIQEICEDFDCDPEAIEAIQEVQE